MATERPMDYRCGAFGLIGTAFRGPDCKKPIFSCSLENANLFLFTGKNANLFRESGPDKSKRVVRGHSTGVQLALN
jgi:hypothetical protein